MPFLSQLLTRRRDASASLVLLIVSIGFSLAVLDVFVVNVALPNIAHDFGSAGLGDLSWVLSAYAIVYAALLVVFGRLADRFPREYGFLLGVAVFTVTAGVALLTLGLVKGDDWGWGSTQTIGVLAASVAVIGSFVLHCLHHRNPLVDPALFRRRSFTGASVVATLFQVAFGGFLLSLVLWDQSVWHWSALHTGLAIAPS